MRRPLFTVLAAAALLAPPLAAQGSDSFNHTRHAKVFPTCTACHSAASEGFGELLPTGAGCAACHDGTIQPRVSWTPPAPAGTNLRFTHGEHGRTVATHAGVDSTLACGACHTPAGSPWMTVESAVVPQCLSCHGVRGTHLAVPDTACATCHLTLAQATTLTEKQVAAFEAPPSHADSGFMSAGGHGRLAAAGTGPNTFGVAPSCATCHAREFCISCHVNAPETPTIQALALDPKSLAIAVRMGAPATHQQTGFLVVHGKEARRSTAACQTCHTQESCVACHILPPKSVSTLYASSPERGAGALVVRSRPPSHQADFSDIHAPLATSNEQTCQGCHVRPQCLDCHRGTPDRTPQYHPQTFLERHPAAAFARETNCSDCHNPGAFCQTCHVQAGLGSPKGALQAGFHDAYPGFLLNHGQAARQSLETCTSCHTERDCLTCHSALYGRGFNPHGPGFDANRLKQKNPQMCTVCHGQLIP